MLQLTIATPDFDPTASPQAKLVVAANGLFLYRETFLYRSLVPAPKAEAAFVNAGFPLAFDLVRPGLRALEPAVQLRSPLPAWIRDRMLTFFRRVWTTHRSEGFLSILCDPVTGAYRLYAPQQFISPAAVAVPADAAYPDGLRRAGTAHSHPCGAFHSGTDQHDEDGADGLHIVMGNLEEARPEIIGALVVGGERVALKEADVFEPDTEMDQWMRNVQPMTGSSRRDRRAS